MGSCPQKLVNTFSNKFLYKKYLKNPQSYINKKILKNQYPQYESSWFLDKKKNYFLDRSLLYEI